MSFSLMCGPAPEDGRGGEWCDDCGKRTDTIFIECLCLIESAEESEDRELDMEVEGMNG
jgi:hypothetical protein